MKSKLTTFAAVSLALFTAHASATDFVFNQTASQLTFSGSYDGEPIAGKFGKFSGRLKLDFTQAQEASFDVSIAVASLNTDYQERDDTLRGNGWFETEKFPTARFVSVGACTVAATSLSCPGTFTLRGISKPLALAIQIDAKTHTLLGSAAINRRDFGIGSGEWDDAGLIADAVKVEFRLRGLKAK